MISDDLVLNLALVISFTNVTGPGLRTCIWLQGCSLKCLNCQNPEFQSYTPQILISPKSLYEDIKDFDNDGITISGGEPLQQAKALSEFLNLYQIKKKTVIIFTGYTKSEIYSSENPYINNILNLSDCIIAGPYRQDQKKKMKQIGSLNKELIFLSSKLKRKEFQSLEWEIKGLKNNNNSKSQNNPCTELFFNGHSLTLSGKKDSNFLSSLLKKLEIMNL